MASDTHILDLHDLVDNGIVQPQCADCMFFVPLVVDHMVLQEGPGFELLGLYVEQLDPYRLHRDVNQPHAHLHRRNRLPQPLAKGRWTTPWTARHLVPRSH